VRGKRASFTCLTIELKACASCIRTSGCGLRVSRANGFFKYGYMFLVRGLELDRRDLGLAGYKSGDCERHGGADYG
jgi:hypothetical protein